MLADLISGETRSPGTIELQHTEVLEKLTEVFEAAAERYVETNQQTDQDECCLCRPVGSGHASCRPRRLWGPSTSTG